MTLTVRLKPEIEAALELHCAERGVTKSRVVQQVLAEYLARPSARKRARAAAPAAVQPSANYRAFEALGLIGAVSGIGPADKAGVRAALDGWAEDKRRSWATEARTTGPPSHKGRKPPTRRAAR